MCSHISIEAQRILSRCAQSEMEIGTDQVHYGAVDRHQLNPGPTGNGEGRPDLDQVPSVPAGRHWPHLDVHGACLVRLVLLHPEHYNPAYDHGAAIGDYAYNYSRYRGSGGNCEVADLAAESAGQRDQEDLVHHHCFA
jgi:hypothetical protein